MYVLNENIRACRRSLGMTQRELAERLGITDKTVSRWESGVQIPDAEMVPSLARIFGVSIGELYGEEKPTVKAEPIVGKEAGKTEKSEKEFPAVNRCALRRIWIAAAVGMFLTLLGATALCLNNIFAYSMVADVVGYLTPCGTTTGRIFGLFAFFAGLTVLFVTLIMYRLWYRKSLRFNFIYADTDMNLRLTAIILCCVLLLFIFPRFLSFSVNVLYIATVYLAAFAVNLDLVLEKRRLRDYPVKTLTVVTVLSWVLGGLSLVALLVCMDLRVIELMGIPPINVSGSYLEVAWRLFLVSTFDSWFSGQYYYFLLTTSVPLTAIVLLNAIELKVCTRRLRAKYPTEYADEPKRKPLLRLIAGVVACAVMIGAVLGMLKLSGVLRYYETITILTDSMSPTLHSGDTVSVCTSVDVEHLQKHNIILFEDEDGLQMLGRIARVNYDRDGQVVSYKIVQDNPDINDRRVVYPQDVIGVWLDAPMPESSDEYEYEYQNE